jgi:hypothetical protein
MLERKSITIEPPSRETEQPEHTSTVVFYPLTDGRMAPIVTGGLVELALSELGARLVDVCDERTVPSGFNLN